MQKWIVAVLAVLVVVAAATSPADARKKGSLKNYSKFCIDKYEACEVNCGIDYPDATSQLDSFQSCLRGCDDLIDACDAARARRFMIPDKNLPNAQPVSPGNEMLTAP
jgi:hypothetical protein